jgi:hypothetical protein
MFWFLPALSLSDVLNHKHGYECLANSADVSVPRVILETLASSCILSSQFLFLLMTTSCFLSLVSEPRLMCRLQRFCSLWGRIYHMDRSWEGERKSGSRWLTFVFWIRVRAERVKAGGARLVWFGSPAAATRQTGRHERQAAFHFICLQPFHESAKDEENSRPSSHFHQTSTTDIPFLVSQQTLIHRLSLLTSHTHKSAIPLFRRLTSH